MTARPVRGHLSRLGAYRLPPQMLPLLVLGICGELIYVVYFVGQFSLLRYYQRDTDLGTITGHSHASFAVFVASLTVLFLVFALAFQEVTAHEIAHAPALIFGFGALFMVTLIFVYPITATDLFSYIAQSQVLVHYHHNPIFTPPAQFPRDPLMRLSDGYQRYGTPYGPLGILVDALPSFLVGSRLLVNLLLLKAMFSAMALGSAYLSYHIVRQFRARLATGAALLIAWNPFVLLEVSVNGHNDIAMMLLVLLALFAVLRERLLIAVLLLAAAGMVKYAAVLLIPLVLVYGAGRHPSWKDRLAYVASAVAWSFAVVAILYFPFWQGTATLSVLTSESQRSANSLSSILYSLHTGRLGIDQTAIAGWAIFVALYGIALWRSVRNFDRLLQGCFLVLFGFLVLAAGNVESWYLLWPVMIAATIPFVAERASAIAFSYCTELSAVVFGYIFVWLGLDLGTIPLLNAITYAITFIPATIVLIVLGRWLPPRPAPQQSLRICGQ